MRLPSPRVFASHEYSHGCTSPGAISYLHEARGWLLRGAEPRSYRPLPDRTPLHKTGYERYSPSCREGPEYKSSGPSRSPAALDATQPVSCHEKVYGGLGTTLRDPLEVLCQAVRSYYDGRPASPPFALARKPDSGVQLC
jgi:hypothetical protein